MVDFLRTCYETDMQIGDGPDAVCRVRWYFVPEGTPDLEIWTPFRSRIWDADCGKWPSEWLGEISGAGRAGHGGSGARACATGKGLCGSEEQWRGGIGLDRPAPRPLSAEGCPGCCDTPAVLLGGGAERPAGAGLLLAVGTERLAPAGLLLGGGFSSVAPPQLGGGVVLGGGEARPAPAGLLAGGGATRLSPAGLLLGNAGVAVPSAAGGGYLCGGGKECPVGAGVCLNGGHTLRRCMVWSTAGTFGWPTSPIGIPMTVETWGPGGRGGLANATSSGGGGGGGGYARQTVVGIAGTLTVVVGAPSGAFSSFQSGSTFHAFGSGGGVGATPGSGTGNSGGGTAGVVVFKGGNGFGAASPPARPGGGGGGSGGATSIGFNATGRTGAAGGTGGISGAGGDGALIGGTPTAGSQPGGGGGGRASGDLSGVIIPGGAGLVRACW